MKKRRIVAAINELCPGTESIAAWTVQNADFVAELRFVLDADFRGAGE